MQPVSQSYGFVLLGWWGILDHGSSPWNQCSCWFQLIPEMFPKTGEAPPTSWTPSFIHVIDDIFTSMMSATSWSFNSWKYLRDLRESKNHMLHSGFSNHDFNVLQYLFCSSQRLLQGKQPKSRITTKLAPKSPSKNPRKTPSISESPSQNHQNSLIQSHPGAWCRDRINPHCW
jgi:hypothetical protein